jgi:hypothetical protein
MALPCALSRLRVVTIVAGHRSPADRHCHRLTRCNAWEEWSARGGLLGFVGQPRLFFHRAAQIPPSPLPRQRSQPHPVCQPSHGLKRIGFESLRCKRPGFGSRGMNRTTSTSSGFILDFSQKNIFLAVYRNNFYQKFVFFI